MSQENTCGFDDIKVILAVALEKLTTLQCVEYFIILCLKVICSVLLSRAVNFSRQRYKDVLEKDKFINRKAQRCCIELYAQFKKGSGTLAVDG